MQLRLLDRNSAEEISKYSESIMFEYYPDVVPYDLLRSYFDENQSPDAIRKQIDDGCRYYYVEDGGERVGFIAVAEEGKSLFLSKYYIQKEFRGKGLGTAVLNEVVAMAEKAGSERIYLHVNRDNSRSIGIYEKNGFVATSKLDTVLSDGSIANDYIMERKLCRR